MRIGKVTESVLNRSVLKLIKSDSNKKSAAGRSDCAYSLDEKGSTIMTAVSTFTAISEAAAYYAVHNAANNIFCDGGKPLMAVLNVMLPVDTEEAELKAIMRSAIAATNELGIAVEGGHTEVTDAVSRPMITAVVSGEKIGQFSEKKSYAGLDIVMTKWAAVEGTAILASECSEKLSERLPDYMIREAQDFKKFVSVRRDAEIALANSGVTFKHDISSGGVFAALWDVAARAHCGLEVDLKKIPIRQESIEITNHLGLNPYQMISGGSLLILTDDGEGLVRAYEETGINAAIIGVTTDSNDKKIINDDEVRYLDKPQPDEILKLAGITSADFMVQ
ncbi:AIR synthase-related protein [Butyrivibrio sp. INlla16]|uniref:AIR synthase-related protein n=1 Tax=Butyrivibrio sp. INlla16 TaxID=1520807 RepID=UPI000891397C|nr:AIR synthase-related protein [Butyrivibrio sp. INlla16]SDB19543.1 Hydrogenase maturation factor [Butyrivibrio sp. INlla16]